MESGTTAHESEGSTGRESRRRVLLVADDVVRGPDLAAELKSAVSEGPEALEIFLITPAIAHSALDQELGNVDQALSEAGERLNSMLAELHSEGFQAEGRIGDADPLVAIGDGLAQFAAQEIFVVTHIDSQAEYAERGIWDRLRSDYHQPVTELKVGRTSEEPDPRLFAVRHAPAHERTREEEIRETRNFPPLRKRDMAGILVGFIGTVALGMIAVAAGNEDSGQLSGGSAAIVLIAVGAFLFNVAHIVGLLFFQSVRYTGIWERFMARGSVLVTSAGLAAALLLWLA